MALIDGFSEHRRAGAFQIPSLLIEYKLGYRRRDQIFLSGSHGDLTFIESPSIELVAVDSAIAKKAELRIESASTVTLPMPKFPSTGF